MSWKYVNFLSFRNWLLIIRFSMWSTIGNAKGNSTVIVVKPLIVIMKDQVRVNVVAMEKFFCSLVLCFLITFAMKSYNSGLHFRNQFEGKYLLCEWHQVDASWMCVCVCGGGGIFIHYGPLKLVVATSEVVAALVFSILVTSLSEFSALKGSHMHPKLFSVQQKWINLLPSYPVNHQEPLLERNAADTSVPRKSCDIHGRWGTLGF